MGGTTAITMQALADAAEAPKAPRLLTGDAQLDRVLSSAPHGAVCGKSVLLGADSGVGKSTLLLQALVGLSDLGLVVYVAAEQNGDQIRELAARQYGGEIPRSLFLLEEQKAETVAAQLLASKPVAFVIDSLNRMRSNRAVGLPGSVLQTRAIVRTFRGVATSTGACAFMISHITKGGDLAGPKDLEHDVDTVLWFERVSETVRRLHVAKNRYGSEAETGMWNMTERGLRAPGRT